MSRLDRLINLLQAGQNPAIKATAATQIGELSRSDTAIPLINKLLPILKHLNWDTRIATASAIGEISKRLSMEAVSADEEQGMLSFRELASIDADELLAQEDTFEYSQTSLKEQKKLLNESLGIGSDSINILSEEDIQQTSATRRTGKRVPSRSTTNKETIYEILVHLLNELFENNWERRHGASVALREIFLNIRVNTFFIEDVLVRLILMFKLDRFNDFVGDTRILPVREACAQVLGIVVDGLRVEKDFELLENLIQTLLLMGEHSPESYFGSLLGLKYILSGNDDIKFKIVEMNYVLQSLVDALTLGDDEKNLACQCLLQVVCELKENHGLLERVLSLLWLSLDELDDLSVSTAAVLDLLSQLMTEESIQSARINCIFQFFRHSISSVRGSVLNMTEKLMKVELEPVIYHDLFEYLLQNILLEEKPELIDRSCALLLSVTEMFNFSEYLSSNYALERIFQSVCNPLLVQMNVSLLPLNPGFRSFAQVDLQAMELNPMDLAMIKQDLEVHTLDQIILNRIKYLDCLSRIAQRYQILKIDNLLKMLRSTGYLYHYLVIGEFMSHFQSEELKLLLIELIYDEKEVQFNDNLDKNRVISCLIKGLLNQLDFFKTSQIYSDSSYKFNPIIRNLMNSIKTEKSEYFLRNSTQSLASMMNILQSLELRKVVDKLINNLLIFYNNSVNIDILNLFTQDDLNLLEDDVDLSLTSVQTVFSSLNREFKAGLFQKLPVLQELIHDLTSNDDAKLSGALIVAKFVVDELEKSLLDSFISSYFQRILHLLYSFNDKIVMNCIDLLVNLVNRDNLLLLGVLETIQALFESDKEFNRFTSSLLVSKLLAKLDMKILQFLVFLLVPSLRRLSDQNNIVRHLTTRNFAQMVKLMPLELRVSSDLPEQFQRKRIEDRKFISQLLDPSTIEKYDLKVKINATLRNYQQDGVNWLYFLYKYNLHGILCDDMGLGKTLQTICILSSTMDVDKINLIVCPASVLGHWKHELLNYTDNLKPLVYSGNSQERIGLRRLVANCNCLITSYEIVRNDLEFMLSFRFHYVVLDEGHLIKNSKSKTTLAIKKVRAEHRLMLSGTPIQNNVLELWSLFDFLMPGFLGSEKQFEQKFAKPIQSMKSIKVKDSTSVKQKDSKEQARLLAEGTLALESLHRQVLPFLLRRLKEDVLKDLPPKIIQDYYCDLSPVQKIIYDQFDKSVDDQNAFKQLQFLRKLCNHPLFVYEDVDEKTKFKIDQELIISKSELTDISHSPKIQSLMELLNECGIGTKTPQHSVLIFCQMKSMLDLIEQEFKQREGISFLRMDGSTKPESRQDIVFKFNGDPSIDCLLLTTSVGGLGLNLTGADTVIFVEHDWNPTNDLQAMDRAHRLGQKRTVNVYRLIMKDTLEERIMGLQQFKKEIANTVVSSDNANAPDLLKGSDFSERFAEQTDEKKRKKASSAADGAVNVRGLTQEVLDRMAEKEKAEEEYEDFGLDQYKRKIKKRRK